jgi:hypothetical protein
LQAERKTQIARDQKSRNDLFIIIKEPANGWRYAPSGVLVGGIGHHPGALPGPENAI